MQNHTKRGEKSRFQTLRNKKSGKCFAVKNKISKFAPRKRNRLDREAWIPPQDYATTNHQARSTAENRLTQFRTLK